MNVLYNLSCIQIITSDANKKKMRKLMIIKLQQNYNKKWKKRTQ